jgi:transposase
MKYISPLSDAEVITLDAMHINHPSSQVRVRAHMILLSHRGYSLQEIASIVNVTRQTVSIVIDNWENLGIAGLYDKPRTGRPHILTPEEEVFVRRLIEEDPRSVKKIQAILEAEKAKQVSDWTIKNILKNGKLKWKRIRKSLKSKRDEQKFRQSQQKIHDMEKRQLQGEIDLFYFDEAGFSLDPSIPYAWQPTGENIEVPASKGTRLNVLGFMSKQNDLTPLIVKGKVDAAIVATCFNELSQNLKKKTFVIMDNSPVHKSKEFIGNLRRWATRGLFVRFLPTYSPELNLIEILWRKIKYEWMPFSAYLSFKALQDALESILQGFGSKHVINFNL